MRLLALLLVVSLALAGCTLPGTGTQYQQPGVPVQEPPKGTSSGGGMMQGGTSHDGMPGMEGGMMKEFTIVASQFKFEPSTITVNKGDHVRLKIKSVDVTHGIDIEGYGINRELKPGQEVVIDFIADKSGDFEFYCSVVCGAGHKEMEGRLIVK